MRQLEYIYNSKSDFIDMWFSLTCLFFGVHSVYFDSFNKNIYYNNSIIQQQLDFFNSFTIGYLFIIIAIINIIKILLPYKLPLWMRIIPKTLTLACVLFLLFLIYANNPVPISIIIYIMLALLAFDNLIRTK